MFPSRQPRLYKKAAQKLFLSNALASCYCINLAARYSLCVCNGPPSAVSKSMDSLLSVIFMLVPVTSLTNKLDLLSEKSQRLVNTPLDLCERQREYLQKEYMSIDRPSWPRLVSTIVHYWCAGIAFEGRQIDIMVWCGPLRAGLPGLKSDWLTLGQSSHLHQLSFYFLFVLRPLDWQACKVLWKGLQFSEPAPPWNGIDPYYSKIEFYCRSCNAIMSAVTMDCIWSVSGYYYFT